MRKQKTRGNHINKKGKKTLLIALGVVLLLGLLLVVLEKKHVTNFVKNPLGSNSPSGSPTDGPTPDQKAAEDALNAANKQKLIESEAATQNKDPQTKPSTPSASDQSITMSARQESNNTVTVFTKLYNYSSGSCNLTVTNGGQTNTQTATVMYQPEYATCAGFSVPVSGLGSGTWNINLKVISNGATTTKSISFEVN